MRITEVEQSAIDSIDFDNLNFGKQFTDYMLVSDFDGEKWGEFSLEPLASLQMHPATSVLHYGQAIFEGLKAYKNEQGEVNIFRLRDNIERMNKSAERMKMPEVDVNEVFDAIVEFVAKQKNWVPQKSQGSMYIRPFMISTDPTLKARPSDTYKLIVIACPVGFYYSTPLSIYLERRYRRAATGGVGYAKAAGNYAASFYPTEKAVQAGFDQILWTDINNNYSLEELGSANFFFVRNNVVYTPAIHDSILKGITRDTVIKLARQKGLEVNETSITSDDFESYLKAGEVNCMFATGTAAAITYVNSITIGDSEYRVSSSSYSPVLEIYQALDAAKFLENRSNPEWNVEVK